MIFLNRALDIEQNTALNPDSDRDIANTLVNIGICPYNLGNYSDSLTFLNRALDIFQNTAFNPDKDRNIAKTFFMLESVITICHHNADICQHILQIAKVKNQNVDLIAKAEQVKALAEDLRTTTDLRCVDVSKSFT